VSVAFSSFKEDISV